MLTIKWPINLLCRARIKSSFSLHHAVIIVICTLSAVSQKTQISLLEKQRSSISGRRQTSTAMTAKNRADFFHLISSYLYLPTPNSGPILRMRRVLTSRKSTESGRRNGGGGADEHTSEDVSPRFGALLWFITSMAASRRDSVDDAGGAVLLIYTTAAVR
jgi:hypothetical protein